MPETIIDVEIIDAASEDEAGREISDWYKRKELEAWIREHAGTLIIGGAAVGTLACWLYRNRGR